MPHHLPLPEYATDLHGPITENQALLKLQEVLRNPLAQWSCEAQKRSVMAVLNEKQDVVSILATGSGKTMQIILPALLQPQQVNVVILPLKALDTDLKRRLNDLGIGYESWSTPTNNPKPLLGIHNIILLTVEQARKSAFKEAIAVLNHTHTVKRFIFDEVHYTFTANHYRDSFTYMDELRSTLPVQFVLMSGTVAPHSMITLQKTFHLTAETIKIRTKTVRPEIQYVLDPSFFSNKDIAKRVGKHIEAYTAQFQSADRGLIYVETKKMLQLLKDELSVPGYEGGNGMTDKERHETYASWIAGTSKWMACTSAFGAGLDWPSVRVVMFAGTPRRLGDTIQAADRGGRNKRHAIALIIPHTSPAPVDQSISTIHTGDDELHALIYKASSGREGCLRYGLSKFNDGMGTACTDLPRAELCSRCQPMRPSEPSTLSDRQYTYRPPMITVLPGGPKRSIATGEDITFEEAQKSSKKRKADRTEHTRIKVDELKQALDHLQSICVRCNWTRPSDCGRSLNKCPEWRLPEWIDYKGWKKTITYKQYNTSTEEQPNICFLCGVPQIGGLHGDFGKRCAYPDKIVPTAFLVWHDAEKRGEAEAYFEVKWKDRTAFTKWLTETKEAPLLNSAELFMWHTHSARYNLDQMDES